MSEKSKKGAKPSKAAVKNTAPIGMGRKILGGLVLFLAAIALIVAAIAMGINSTVLDETVLGDWIENDLLSETFLVSVGEGLLLTSDFSQSADHPLVSQLSSAYQDMSDSDKGAFISELLPASMLADLIQDPIGRVIALVKGSGSAGLGDLNFVPIKAQVQNGIAGASEILVDSAPSCGDEETIALGELLNPVPPSYTRDLAISIVGKDVWRIEVENPNLFTNYVVEEVSLTIDGEIRVMRATAAPPDCRSFEELTIPAGGMDNCKFEVTTDKADQVEEGFLLIMNTEIAEEHPAFAYCQLPGEGLSTLSHFTVSTLAQEIGANVGSLPDRQELSEVITDAKLAEIQPTLALVGKAPLNAGLLGLVLLGLGSWIMSGMALAALMPAGITALVSGIGTWVVSSSVLPDLAKSNIKPLISEISDTLSGSASNSLLTSLGSLLDGIWSAIGQNGMILAGVGLAFAAINYFMSRKKTS
jgi:hypothetical protein